MYPAVFSPSIWDMLHVMAMTYPEHPDMHRQRSMSLLLQNLCPNLPCPGCGQHCQLYITENPPNVSHREDLKLWLYTFHNAVNTRLGKRNMPPEEAEKRLKELYFDMSTWSELSRAQEVRREDHVKITELENSQGIASWMAIVIIVGALICGFILGIVIGHKSINN